MGGVQGHSKADFVGHASVGDVSGAGVAMQVVRLKPLNEVGCVTIGSQDFQQPVAARALVRTLWVLKHDAFAHILENALHS